MAAVCGEGDKVGLSKETARIGQCSDLQIPGVGRAREERQHTHVLHILKGYLGTFMNPGEGNHGVSRGRELSLAERRCHPGWFQPAEHELKSWQRADFFPY